MNQTMGEFLDRISILLHKCQKIGEVSYPEFIKYAEEFLLEMPIDASFKMLEALRELYRINGEIWKLESQLRNGLEEQLGYDEVGRRAILIRNWNSKRIAVQNEINELTGEAIQYKKDHISEDKDE